MKPFTTVDGLGGVVVIGSGVAGSAVASTLCRQGYKVTLVYRQPREGSSFTNQKWRHSGLLYPAESTARKACQEFLGESPLRRFEYPTRCSSRFLALNQRTLDERAQLWGMWKVMSWGLTWRCIETDECRAIDPLGATNAVGGFEVPDLIVDFPALIGHLREEIRTFGGEIIGGAVSRLGVAKNTIRWVELFDGRDQRTIECSRCVLTAGAWSNRILNDSEITSLDLILRKCVVLEYEKELVPGLTTCLDVQRHDGTPQDVTLVPFRGTTLAAGTGYTEVLAGDDLEPDRQEVERLTDELFQCFPTLRSWQPRILTCTKTEKRPGGKSNVHPQVYGPSFHGVNGLAVAFPGKAGFMFDLAEQVVAEIEGYATSEEGVRHRS